jgi:hypothetical protein
MKILILLAYDRYTGVTTWASDMADGLNADILIWMDSEPTKGLQYKHDRVLAKFPTFDSYDVIIVSYAMHLTLLKEYKGKVMYVVHGQGRYAEHYLIQPNSRTPDVIVGVSDSISKTVYADITIPHGVNTDLFHPGDDTIEYPFLWHCRMQIPKVLKALYGTDIVKIPACSPEEMAVHIRKAQYVIGVGRSALEAVASGKRVFIWAGAEGSIHNKKYGGWYDGWLTTSNFRKLQRVNFNGSITCSVFNNEAEIQAQLVQVPTAPVVQDVSTTPMLATYTEALNSMIN